jgi:hypothetical protein
MDDAEEAVAAVGRIDAVGRILDVVCRTTGMGFAAVARVTEDRWIACAAGSRPAQPARLDRGRGNTGSRGP